MCCCAIRLHTPENAANTVYRNSMPTLCTPLPTNLFRSAQKPKTSVLSRHAACHQSQLGSLVTFHFDFSSRRLFATGPVPSPNRLKPHVKRVLASPFLANDRPCHPSRICPWRADFTEQDAFPSRRPKVKGHTTHIVDAYPTASARLASFSHLEEHRRLRSFLKLAGRVCENLNIHR